MMEHKQPIKVCSNLALNSRDIRHLLIESFQADYVIICYQKNKHDKKPYIVKSQLEDLHLKQGALNDYMVFKEEVVEKPNMLNCWNFKCCKKKKVCNEDRPFRFFFAIKFTGQKIDDIAHNNKIRGDLDASNIQCEFRKEMS